MKVLGIATEGDSGAAIAEDGRILAALNEERTSRMKLVEGFPRTSIRETLRLAATTVEELDAVLVSSRQDLFVDELQPFEGWFQHWERAAGLGGTIKRAAGKLSRYRDRLPGLERAYYLLLEPTFRHRRRSIRRILRREFGVRCPIHFVDHHLAHIASAYFTSGFDDALVISLDGGGDGKSGTVYAARTGRLEHLHTIAAFNSLGNYYAYATHICGFKAQKHEGKLTGLAAHGEPRFLPLLRDMIVEENGTFINRAGVVFGEAARQLERRLPAGWKREDLAASIQRHFEELVPRFVQHWARRTGLRNVAVAGGVFANVRVNQEVHRLPEVDRIFIHPHMGDGGLGVGAALAACVPGLLPVPMTPDPNPLEHVYLGPGFDDDEIAAALRKYGLTPERSDDAGAPFEERIAELLAAGHVVARAAGRMEYGPRALGNRSILYQATDPGVNDWLNKNLHRTEFMPFAPSVLYEHREACFEDLAGGEHAAEFMTITFDCTPWMRRRMPGVVHIDGTARPQLVRREVNPEYHRIIEAYHRRTGLPGIINTSFNMHEEPIVCSADDCVRAFLDGKLDYLAIGRFIVKHPRPARRPVPSSALAPAAARGSSH
ncbi:MAG TPA: carbamoyltransferase C-terminal domain-containing protein [Longimicrobiales bacterium]